MSSPKMERTKEPSIYKRGGRYVFVWRDRGVQRKEFFPTFALAREAKRQRQGGDRRKRPRIRVRDYARDWIDGYRGRTARGFSESTRREYRRDLENQILPSFGGWWLSDVEPSDVRVWFGHLEARGLSASAVRKAKATFSAMYATAREDGAVRANPVTGTRYIPGKGVEAPKTFQPLTLHQLEQAMKALPPRWRLFVAMLGHTGLRVSELLGLTWQHVHLGDDAHLQIVEQVYKGERKGLKSANATRRLPISPGLAAALTALRSNTEFGQPQDPVFASSVGTPLDYSAVYKRVWIPARQAAGIPADQPGAFHRLRKTAGSLIHHQGKTARQLGDWLGHADPSFSLRVYVGQTDEGLGDAGFMDDLIPVNGSATSYTA